MLRSEIWDTDTLPQKDIAGPRKSMADVNVPVQTVLTLLPSQIPRYGRYADVPEALLKNLT